MTAVEIGFYGALISTASLIAYYQLKDFRRTKKIKVVFVLSILWLMFVLYSATLGSL